MHRKRLSAPKTWKIKRKEEPWSVSSRSGPHSSNSVPLVVFIRDILEYAHSEDEVKYILRNSEIKINGRRVKDHRIPLGVFDILSFPSLDEYYRVFPEGKKLSLVKIEEEAANDRLVRIEDKKYLKDGIQLNLHDGSNLLVDEDEYITGSSLVLDLETNDIIEHFPLEEDSIVTSTDGKHAGELGRLVEIHAVEGSNPNLVSIEREDGSIIETLKEYVFVIGEDTESLQEQEA